MEASNRYYQFAFCPGFWGWLERENAAGKLVSIDRVLQEIEDGKHGPLAPWAKAHPNLFLKSADENTMNSLKAVAVWISNNYSESTYAPFLKGADFVLVGYAIAHKHTVVTQETNGGPKNLKIPEVCKAFNVDCINCWEMLKKEAPQFALQ
jgi:hypothetical protein